MLTKRIIPCLDVTLDEAGGCVVKGIEFEDLRRAGDPVELAKEYNLQGADELVFLDITASHEGRSTMIDVIEHMFDAFVDGHADAALAASIFHFGEYSVGDVKEYLDDRSVPVRIVY